MAKLYGMHPIVLRPGVKEEDFEKFMAEESPKFRTYEGWKSYLLKGNRGDRNGRYLFLIEVESVEARDRYMPADNVGSEEAKEWFESLSEEEKAFRKKFGEKYATFTPSNIGENTLYTDYVVIAESG